MIIGIIDILLTLWSCHLFHTHAKELSNIKERMEIMNNITFHNVIFTFEYKNKMQNFITSSKPA